MLSKILLFHCSLIHPVYDVKFYSHTFVVDILHSCAIFFVQLYYINFPFSRSITSFVVGSRMVGNSDAGGENGEMPLPPPPPLHPTLVEILRRSEESQQTQNQIMQAIVQHLGGRDMVDNAMVIPLSWPPTLLSFVDQRSLWMLIFGCVP